MDFALFSAVFRVAVWLYAMYSAGDLPVPVVVPEPVDQFQTAFPSIQPETGYSRCTQHYQICRTPE